MAAAANVAAANAAGAASTLVSGHAEAVPSGFVPLQVNT